MRRIGIDVGGTHTDAVLLDGDDIVQTTKALTTADVLTGVTHALDAVLSAQTADSPPIEAVMLGTTQFTNAVVERRELAEVAAVRIGLPSGRGLPPKIGWPVDIAEALGDCVSNLHGGYLFDGHPIAPMDTAEMQRAIDEIKRRRLRCVAVTSAFAPMNAEPERAFGAMLAEALPEVHLTLSHRMGRLGLLERENAALLNASLLPFAERVVAAFETAIGERGLDGRFYISQNDGTLMDVAFARRFPALTFASGPTNSLRGACRLTGLDNAIVIDIGGTTSDIGVLRDGFPRESNVVIEVGGVRTNFRMPDILAVGLGGGSEVSADGHQVGPRSVGHRLVQEARVFGGATLTATDILVADGAASIGDRERVAGVPAQVRANARARMAALLDEGIERMKPDRSPLPVVLVGGGALLVPGPLPAASEVLRPAHAEVANAIGAAIAQIGGEAERLVSYDDTPREQALADLTGEARRRALAAGAAENSLRVADIEETPLSYSAGAAAQLRVKVVGDLSPSGFAR
ncbi:MAG: hydantoinase/oxoprolinase family protein [Pseudomonadota bacterium]